MKKPVAIMVIAFLFTLSSCGSSWSCKKRYCDKDQQNKTVIVVTTNDVA